MCVEIGIAQRKKVALATIQQNNRMKVIFMSGLGKKSHAYREKEKERGEKERRIICFAKFLPITPSSISRITSSFFDSKQRYFPACLRVTFAIVKYDVTVLLILIAVTLKSRNRGSVLDMPLYIMMSSLLSTG